MPDDSFEREKACFEHNTSQMRALNEQMTRVPPIAITLTGGLWFAASQVPALDETIKFGLLIFAGIANVGLAFSCFRIRDVMQSYLEKIEEFAPAYFVSGRPKNPFLRGLSDYSMISIYASLMFAAAIMSFTGALTAYWPFALHRCWGLVVLAVAFAICAFIARRRTTPVPTSAKSPGD
jgi:hypothetical protein